MRFQTGPSNDVPFPALLPSLLDGRTVEEREQLIGERRETIKQLRQEVQLCVVPPQHALKKISICFFSDSFWQVLPGFNACRTSNVTQNCVVRAHVQTSKLPNWSVQYCSFPDPVTLFPILYIYIFFFAPRNGPRSLRPMICAQHPKQISFDWYCYPAVFRRSTLRTSRGWRFGR
jgi:hypothetical protein